MSASSRPLTPFFWNAIQFSDSEASLAPPPHRPRLDPAHVPLAALRLDQEIPSAEAGFRALFDDCPRPASCRIVDGAAPPLGADRWSGGVRLLV